MKTLRIIDLLGQMILCLSALVFGILEISGHSELFFYFYFIVGAWQISSMLIHHFFIRPTLFHDHRDTYAKMSLIVLVIGIICAALVYVSPGFIFLLGLYLFGLLLYSPVLAFFYFYICWREYGLIIKRELIHLK